MIYKLHNFDIGDVYPLLLIITQIIMYRSKLTIHIDILTFIYCEKIALSEILLFWKLTFMLDLVTL